MREKEGESSGGGLSESMVLWWDCVRVCVYIYTYLSINIFATLGPIPLPKFATRLATDTALPLVSGRLTLRRRGRTLVPLILARIPARRVEGMMTHTIYIVDV